MPAVTPIYGLPYPIAADPLSDTRIRLQALAQQIEATLAGWAGTPAAGAWTQVGSGGGAPAFGAGFGQDPGGYQRVKYRKVGSEVIGRGLAVTSAATAANAQVYTLPVGFRPLSIEGHLTWSTGGTTGFPRLDISPAGVVSCASALAAGTFLWVAFRLFVD